MLRRKAADAAQPLWLWAAAHQARGARKATRRGDAKLAVELAADVPGVGAEGAAARVAPGFARNFLLPNRLAAIRPAERGPRAGGRPAAAAAAAAAPAAAAAARGEDAAARAQRRLEAAVKKLTTAQLVLRRRAKDGALERPVGAADVVAAVARQLGVDIAPELVDLGGEELGKVGEYRLPLKLVLPGGVRAAVDVTVQST
jgi:ribosomal protein L9